MSQPTPRNVDFSNPADVQGFLDAVYYLWAQVNDVNVFTVATLPPAADWGPSNRLTYVSDESGGAVLAFSDGANWRRVTDRAVVS